MTAPELTPDVFTAVADWLEHLAGDDPIFESVVSPNHLMAALHAHARQLRAEAAEDERLGAMVYKISQPAHHFSSASNSVRDECIRIGRAIQADTIEKQATEPTGRDPWPKYELPPHEALKDLGEKLIWKQQNSPDGASLIGSHAISWVYRLYELRLRDEPLTDEPGF